MNLVKKFKDYNISESLKYHINNHSDKLLLENVYRYGSEEFFKLILEAKSLYESGKIELSDIDKEILSTDIGEKALYNEEYVFLDIPMFSDNINENDKFKNIKVNSPTRDSHGGKSYKVYVKGCVKPTKTNPKGIKMIRFGSGGLKAKINDPDRRKAYDDRHGCSKGKHEDKCKPGYWSCRLPRYAKQLNLSGSGQWW